MTIGLDLKDAAQERMAAGACLPTNAAERKAVPMAEGLLYYFPNALAEVARVSKRGNDQHNPNEPMHWAMEKSTDHADCIMRHLADAGTRDTDGMRHSAKVAWRALALLESELIAEGATPGRNAIRAPSPDYDPASVAFRHGELDKVCGVPRVGRNLPQAYRTHYADGVFHTSPPVTPCHPMHAEAIRAEDETPWRLP